MWLWMVGGWVRARSRSIITEVICVRASRCLGGGTSIGIAIPGGGLVICSTSCACTTSSRRTRRGSGYSKESGGERRWGDGDNRWVGDGGSVCAVGAGLTREYATRGVCHPWGLAGRVAHPV